MPNAIRAVVFACKNEGSGNGDQGTGIVTVPTDAATVKRSFWANLPLMPEGFDSIARKVGFEVEPTGFIGEPTGF